MLTHCNPNAKIPNFRPSNAAPPAKCPRGRPPSPHPSRPPSPPPSRRHWIRCCETSEPPRDFLPGDVSVLEVAEHVHLTEDAVLVEERTELVVAALLFVVVVFIFALSQLALARRQQSPRLRTATNHVTSRRTMSDPMADTMMMMTTIMTTQQQQFLFLLNRLVILTFFRDYICRG